MNTSLSALGSPALTSFASFWFDHNPGDLQQPLGLTYDKNLLYTCFKHFGSFTVFCVHAPTCHIIYLFYGYIIMFIVILLLPCGLRRKDRQVCVLDSYLELPEISKGRIINDQYYG